jgi:hypothetical protein
MALSTFCHPGQQIFLRETLIVFCIRRDFLKYNNDDDDDDDGDKVAKSNTSFEPAASPTASAFLLIAPRDFRGPLI